MDYEVAKHREYPDIWLVEAIDHAQDGAVYAAEFRGPDARIRAQEYARWKNEPSRASRAESRAEIAAP